MATYKPEPINTLQVVLPGNLADLTEKLAKNAHDNWAAMRMKDGWTWGPERDDKLKKHPDLVPYEELSQSEKQYDRTAAMETLKAMLAIGYRIEPI
ncbi:MAG: Ryanodine receptor Ryr [Planctomycetes bacterium]|nr:Ryanodine receptor Ryr [Planctomycetota bacterium]